MFGSTKKVHFVGIGGIGMSGIAELLHNQGFDVSGTDMRESEMTRHLSDIGINVKIGHDPDVVIDADVVVKSSAVTNDNPEVKSALSRKIPVIRRAEMLAEITRMSYGIGIAGTHGKTTTTSMVGMVLKAADLDPTVIVGGKVKNFSSNNLLGNSEYIVVEADEFDQSFLSLTPIIAGVTNIDADHLDCYPDLDGIKDAFTQYANKVPFFGSIVACLDDPGVQSVLPRFHKKVITYGHSRQADVRAMNIEMKDFHSSYDVVFKGYTLGRIELQVPGHHNILNSLMAVSIALDLNIAFEAIQKGLADYSGVFRRFEYKGELDGAMIYDDYAHHPTEILATLKGIRANTDRRLVVVFQPHLYSRTRDFYEDFGRSFFQSDILLVTPIYPAREKPIEGVTGELIANAAIQSGHRNVKYIETNEEIISAMRDVVQKDDILITMGAGSIWQYGEKLLKN